MLNVHKNHKAFRDGGGEGGGWVGDGGGGGGGGRGRGRGGGKDGVGGGEREIIYPASLTVTTRMTPAIRWAAMTAILTFREL